MSDPRPVYALGADGPARAEVLGLLADLDPTPVEPGELRVEEREPGVVVLVSPELQADELLEAGRALARGRGEWTSVVASPSDDGWTARTLSLGYRHPLEEVGAVARDEEEPVLLDLRRTLSRISRARHDINNPLTSGLAEAQLALMDARDPAVKEALETIEAQFRRIRDLVGGITWLRHAE